MPDEWDDCHRVLPGWTRSNDVPDQGGKLGLGGHPLPEQIIHQHRIGKLQEAGKRGPLLGGGCGENAAREALEQHIQLLHATPATPQETASLNVECGLATVIIVHMSDLTRALRG
jgi:hypothetical protein